MRAISSFIIHFIRLMSNATGLAMRFVMDAWQNGFCSCRTC